MNWTVSRGGASGSWSIHLNGRLVLDGYDTSKDALWAMGYLATDVIPPYLPPTHDHGLRMAKLVRALEHIRRHGQAPLMRAVEHRGL